MIGRSAVASPRKGSVRFCQDDPSSKRFGNDSRKNKEIRHIVNMYHIKRATQFIGHLDADLSLDPYYFREESEHL
jgi:hypothetical protein